MTVKLTLMSRSTPVFGDDELLELEPSAREVAAMMRAGELPSDYAFDRFLPDELRVVSRQHWTRLGAAWRAAQWLDEFGVGTVVDLGSGAGKFCVAAALAGHGRFVGLEQRPGLVLAAQALARTFEVEHRVHFVQGVLGEVEPPEAEAYYLYNPFGENRFGVDEQVDGEVELSLERFDRDVAVVERFLARAPVGTYVLTYNGFGGVLPASYEQLRLDAWLPNELRLSRKSAG